MERACPLCFGARPVVELGVRKHAVQTRNGKFEWEFHDCVCTGCGFAMARNVPDLAFLKDYYAGAFQRITPGGAVPFGFDVEFRLQTLHENLPAGARVLEAGADDGAFVRCMIAAGFDARGLDLVDGEDGALVVRGAFEESGQSMPAADAVVSYYLLEHIVDPRQFLQTCRTMLTEGGLLVIEVPNLQTYPSEALYHEHFSYFTDGTLAALVEATGFKIIASLPRTASRYFGQTLVARMEHAKDAAVPLLAPGDVSDAVEEVRNLIAKGTEEIRARNDAADALIAKILAGVDGDPQKVEIIVWGANLMATAVGQAAARAGINKSSLVDRSPGKIGYEHDGFGQPVRAPEFTTTASHKRAFVICSEVWSDHIRQDIEAMCLSDIAIYSAFAPRS